MKTKHLALALAAALACPTLVHAQPSADAPVTNSGDDTDTGTNAAAGKTPGDELAAVTVVGVRVIPLPRPESVLADSELEAKAAASSDTAQLLKGIAGLSLQGAGGVSSLPSIRGLADDRVRIVVDGMDLVSSCANHMNSPLSYVDPSRVAKLEVFAGITPVSLGGDSLGGTIRVESAEPVFAGPGEGQLIEGKVGAFYRSNGQARGMNLSTTFAGENISLDYNGSSAEADNYHAGKDFKPPGPAAAGRRWLDGDEVGSTYYKSVNQSLRLALRQGQHLFQIRYGRQDIPRQGFPNQRMDMVRNDSEQWVLQYQGGFAWGGLEASAYHEHTRHSMQFGPDKLYWYGPTAAQDGQEGPTCSMGVGCFAAGMPMETEGNTFGASLKADIRLSARDSLRLGAELQQYRLDDYWPASGRMMGPDPFVNINDGRRDRKAAYVEWQADWSPRWLTQAGLRVERVDSDAGPVQSYNMKFSPADVIAFNSVSRQRQDDNVDATVLARYTPSATARVEFGLAQKTRSPNLYERYAWSTGGMAMLMVNMAGDGNGYVGNLGLRPETARSLSVTADWHDAADSRWNLRVTPWITQVEDYIDAERCYTAMPMGPGPGPTMPVACSADNLLRQEGFVYLRFVNQSARLHGLDLSASIPVLDDSRLGRVSGHAQLGYVHGRNRSTDDNLYNMMPLHAELSLEQVKGSWTGRVELELAEAQQRVSATRNELSTAAYALLHLRGSYQWRRLRMDFGAENVFNRYYSLPLGGAYVGQGKTMSGTGVPWGLAVPGKGRSLYASINLDF